MENLIIKETDKLNEKFGCIYQIIGREGYYKLARFAISVAAFLVSTDKSFEDIIVKKEHIEWASSFIDRNYSRSYFALDKYAAAKKKLEVLSKEDSLFMNTFYESETNKKLIQLLINETGANSAKELQDRFIEKTVASNIVELKDRFFIDDNSNKLWAAVKLRK